MDSPHLRPASHADVDALSRLKLETFRETFLEEGFAVPYPPADLAVYVAEAYGPDAIAAGLAHPDKMTWVAEQGGRLVGYAHVGPTKLPHPDAQPHHGELYQLYVRREAQGLKLGGRLLTAALDHLIATRPGPIWLGVWSGNHRAQAFYAARGFTQVGGYAFPVGAWRDDEFIFRRG